jgi:hypothetical protein
MVGVRFALAASAIVACSAFAACSTSNQLPPLDLSGEDSVDEDAGPIGTTCFGPDAGCSGILLCGPQVFVNQSMSAMPTGTGGAITPGVYSLTSLTVYNGKTGALQEWDRETFQVFPAADAGAGLGIAYPWLDVSQSTESPYTSVGGTLTPQGTSIDFGFSCGLSADTEATYTATATSITAYFAGVEGVADSALTYTLQQ